MSEKRGLRMADITFITTFLKYFSSPFSIVLGGTKMPVEFGYRYSPIDVTDRRTETINLFTFAPECFTTGFAFVKKALSVFSFYWRRFIDFAISKFIQMARRANLRTVIFFFSTFAKRSKSFCMLFMKNFMFTTSTIYRTWRFFVSTFFADKINFFVSFYTSHNNAPLKLWVNSGKPRPGNPEPSRLSNLRKVQRLKMPRLIESITYVIRSVKGIILNSAQHESEKIVQAK